MPLQKHLSEDMLIPFGVQYKIEIQHAIYMSCFFSLAFTFDG